MAENSPADRPKAKSPRPLLALWPFLRPYKGILAAAMTALLVASGAMLGLPIALKGLIDKGMAAGSADVINGYFIAFMGVAVLFGVFAAIRFYLVTWLGERVVADVRTAVYRNVVRMDPQFFEITRTGEVLSRLTTDTTLVQSISGSGLSIALRSSINLIGSLVLLAITNIKLLALIMVAMPVVIVPVISLGRKLRKLSRSSQDKVADTSGLAGETLNAIQTVQAFTLEELNTQRYADAVRDSFDIAVVRTRVRAWLTALSTMLVFGAITLVLWFGARQVLAGHMTGGELGQFLLLAVYAGVAAASLSEMWSEVQRAAGAMERLVELQRATPSIVAPKNPVALPVPRADAPAGRASFENVRFNYPSRPDTSALDDFSLDIAPGETVAFVGPSGAGKSTAFQLLLRFYDPQHGRVLIDGVNLADADPQAVRRRIGLVPQDTVLFGTSARENIRYGRPDATDAEVEAAARAAFADDFIRALPQGYETFLGERGTRLSGGQRQRIAIARAILKNPPLLLLDEATSALDAESERVVQGALEKLMESRTTIIIAHRLATVLKADRIVVMDHGRIVAIGRHDELVASNPLYARLAALQFTDGPGLA
ncbi:MAG: ABC transporter transmembrane domain-containing protein [Steroidobacteraceae bacterium]|jgi:ATP-binding cassette subfamily B protein|nr:ATP-binding cassette domain-containing protein [Gammaproteobacteria bacterium]